MESKQQLLESICAAKECELLKISAKSYMRWVRHDEGSSGKI